MRAVYICGIGVVSGSPFLFPLHLLLVMPHTTPVYRTRSPFRSITVTNIGPRTSEELGRSKSSYKSNHSPPPALDGPNSSPLDPDDHSNNSPSAGDPDMDEQSAPGGPVDEIGHWMSASPKRIPIITDKTGPSLKRALSHQYSPRILHPKRIRMASPKRVQVRLPSHQIRQPDVRLPTQPKAQLDETYRVRQADTYHFRTWIAHLVLVYVVRVQDPRTPPNLWVTSFVGTSRIS